MAGGLTVAGKFLNAETRSKIAYLVIGTICLMALTQVFFLGKAGNFEASTALFAEMKELGTYVLIFFFTLRYAEKAIDKMNGNGTSHAPDDDRHGDDRPATGTVV